MSRRIGIFGGSFNPPHNGHRHLVEVCLKKFHLDEIYIIPCYQNPEKPTYQTTPDNRLKMLQTLFQEVPKTKILDCEIKRREVSYTIDTLEELDLGNSSYLIIGEDLLFQMHQWKSYKKIIEKVNLLVILHSNGTWMSDKDQWPVILKSHLKKIDGLLDTKKEIHFLETKKFQNLSSGLIRSKVQSKISIEEDVPKKLISFVQDFYSKPILQKEHLDDLVSFLKDKGAVRPEWFSFEEAVYENILVLSGLNVRHVQSLSSSLQEYIKEKHGFLPRYIEGDSLSQWIVLDYQFLIVHIFYDYLRGYYHLEEFWKKRSLKES